MNPSWDLLHFEEMLSSSSTDRLGSTRKDSLLCRRHHGPCWQPCIRLPHSPSPSLPTQPATSRGFTLSASQPWQPHQSRNNHARPGRASATTASTPRPHNSTSSASYDTSL